MKHISEREALWLQNDGAIMMSELGIKKGNSVVDFGSGQGRYTIPLSQLTGKNGQVYAFERDKEALAVLNERLPSFSPERNVQVMNGEGSDIKSHLKRHGIDAILAFDVLQYIDDWDILFASFKEVLKKKGSLHIYPAALPHPGSVNLEVAIFILEKYGFELEVIKEFRMMHNVDMVDDKVYSFRLK